MGRPNKRQVWSRNISRALSKMTPERLQLLRDVFIIDGTIEEACLNAGITPPTFYNWREKNPDLFSKLEALRDTPVLKARRVVVEGIEGDKNFAMAYLGRKAKDMIPKSKVEVDAAVDYTDSTNTEVVRRITREYEDKLYEAILATHKNKKP